MGNSAARATSFALFALANQAPYDVASLPPSATQRIFFAEGMCMGDVILYIAASLDGFIARRNDDISWLTAYDGGGEDYGYAAFYARVGAVITRSGAGPTAKCSDLARSLARQDHLRGYDPALVEST